MGFIFKAVLDFIDEKSNIKKKKPKKNPYSLRFSILFQDAEGQGPCVTHNL